MKRLIPLFIFSAFLLFSCKNETKKTAASTLAVEAVPVNTGIVINTLPALPANLLQNLYDNVSAIDFILKETNFSISQTDKPSMQTTVANLNGTAPENLNKTCKSMGAIIFQIDGNIALEADIYFKNECLYYIFLVEGKPTYAASFTQGGFNFLNQIIQAGTQGQR